MLQGLAFYRLGRPTEVKEILKDVFPRASNSGWDNPLTLAAANVFATTLQIN
jgi:hypothetical protein